MIDSNVLLFFRFLKVNGAYHKYIRKMHDLNKPLDDIIYYSPLDYIVGMFPWGSESQLWQPLHSKWVQIFRQYKTFIINHG